LGQPKPVVGYFGRICAIKGLDTVVEVARRFPDTKFVICGQGEDVYSDKADNLFYQPPLHGADRGAFLGSLACLLAPSVYLEPFCGVNVEAQLCGTPVVATDAGAFAETVEHGATGLLCHTLADFCRGVERALEGGFDRGYIRKRAQERYDMYQVAHQYDYAFRCIADLQGDGWYARESHLS
jgi:glycosyltransferase involved in cell wall biosynthesis